MYVFSNKRVSLVQNNKFGYSVSGNNNSAILSSFDITVEQVYVHSYPKDFGRAMLLARNMRLLNSDQY